MLDFLNLISAISWDVSPEIFQWKFINLRWYGLLFATGFIIGYFIFSKIYKIEGKPQEDLETLLTYMVIATVVGSRLGHCLFYDPVYYLSNPLEILKIWKGGLASHGGTIGLLVALFLYSKKHPDQPYLWLLDRIVIPIALAGTFIRLGNLMNSEIYGGVTDLPWGFIYLQNGETLAKHPTQLYEAGSYLLIFCYLIFSYLQSKRYTPRGRIFGQFLILLFGARFIIEFVKNVQEAWEIDMVASYGINMGQLLSLPFIIIGTYFFVRSFSEGAKKEAIEFAENSEKMKSSEIDSLINKKK
ncbi:prolipoprotein diacylglyceryl transferase [Bernardetia litoralis DSM 6794]|uniref:Phosphatidylglycerol--prolipoprotein diacylglyceryl transferase n=1 Tax=Bernardetia litoralis (strain ATCC 23117 / DSM 6794 / NBRC 15988 / NCIMB 1366 / Fx l1 / Sio-4) TaxID=880071 RepID=I4ALG5_BERLS|nr:prolipoprotein diacylglyceryl transferase [Bernardetia litoralis]AFM04800.1 prolipoprotein diacylglyceryl transferase [Bernardetia litoralis DSM 6794]